MTATSSHPWATGRWRWRAAVLLAAWAAVAPLQASADAPDDSTPRRALHRFIESGRAADYQVAATLLDLAGVAPARRAEEGPRLARQLKFVLDRELWIDWDEISDTPEGDPADGPGVDRIGEIRAGDLRVPIRLVRLADGNWRIGKATVLATPRLYQQYGPGWIGEVLPPVLMDTRLLEVEAWQWIGIGVASALAALAALLLGTLLRVLSRRLARTSRLEWDRRLVETLSGPARALLGLALLAPSLEYLRLPAPAQAVASSLLRSIVILALTWAGLRAVDFLSDLVTEHLDRRDGGAARAKATRVMVLRRVAGIVVLVLGTSLILRQFDGLRAVGTSLLASAGVAGIVIGFAAQKSIGTLLAGLQISLAEPFRVGDVVVMEGEWGTVEEVTLTYVVLKVWDQRRLVIPIARVLETPFQNWSRAGTELLGTVFVHADYGVPVEAVRQEVQRFANARPEWDGRVAELQVTGATDRTVELRALVSAPDAGKAWDLRCALRENLVTFLQHLDEGSHLPRVRVEPTSRG